MTSGRYAIAGGHPFKGHKVSEFARIMQERISRMVKPRRSSSGFFQISWNALISAIADYVPANYKSHFKSVAGKGGRKVPASLGTFTPARANEAYALCKIENNLGMDNKYPNLAQRRNEAAHRILGPILQQSIDRNFQKQIEIAASKGLLDQAVELRALGFKLS